MMQNGKTTSNKPQSMDFVIQLPNGKNVLMENSSESQAKNKETVKAYYDAFNKN